MKNVCIRSFSGPYFPTFGINTERYSVKMRENKDQNNSQYGHFLRSGTFSDILLQKRALTGDVMVASQAEMRKNK